MSCLAVINVTSLISTGEPYGLNFFHALTPDYIIPTLVLFFLALIGIFSSVSSSIFEKESGKGIGLRFGDKEEKGYSRWAKADEIKKDNGVQKIIIKEQESTAGGIPLINNGKEMWVDNGSYHTLVIGATGSGKTKCLVDPQLQSLARRGESMILTDPKGELYRDHSEMLRSRGYKIVVLNFRDPQMGNAWNPLSLPYHVYKQGNSDKALELLEDVALNIIYDPENKNDPFWEKSASDFFSALALGLFEDAKEEQINLNSINYMSNAGEENFATSTYTKEYFTLKGEKSTPYIFAANTINAPQDTKGSILSVFRQKIRLFARGGELSEMLSYSDFQMADIGKEKTAVFMIIHDEKTTYHALATIFLKQAYETLVDVAQHSPKGKLPFRTNFILDEFANMPPLKDVTTMVTAARSRDIRFTFIIQNFAQLNDVYGKETAETIRSNCGNLIYLMTTELAALEEISKLCGEVKSKEKDKTASTPLITVSDLQKLKLFEVIILRSRVNPFRTQLKPSFEIDWGTSGYGDGQLVRREKRDIEQFDIKEFVKVKKRNKLFEALDTNPTKETNKGPVEFDFGNSSTPNPFGNKEESKPNFSNPFDPSKIGPNSFGPSPFTPTMTPPKEEPSAVKSEPNNINFADKSDEFLNNNRQEISQFRPQQNSSLNPFTTFVPPKQEEPVKEYVPSITFDPNELDEETKDIFETTNKMFETTPTVGDNDSKFDIDSLIKRIDAQIAELEKKEKAEAEKEANEVKLEEPNIAMNPKPTFIPETIEEPKVDIVPTYETLDTIDMFNEELPSKATNQIETFNDLLNEKPQETKKEEPTIVNIDNDSKIVEEVTDDQFYDDFFLDE